MLKIDYTISIIEQPSTNKKLKFRPFLVKEEKILLISKENGKFQSILLAVKQIIQNCCLEPNFDVNKITTFDLEYIFLKLRAISINNIQRFISKDQDDGKEYQHTINLDDVKIIFPENKQNNKIEVNKDITILLKYPTCDIIDDHELEEKIKKEGIFEIIINCVDKIFDKNTLVKLNYKEKEEFINNLTIPIFKQMEAFILNMPKLEYKIYWKNSLGTEKAWVFKSLKDFFLFL